LPHDSKNELLVAIDNIKTANIDQTELEGLSDIDNVVAVLDEFEARGSIEVDSRIDKRYMIKHHEKKTP
jgi:hypothetical protein